MADSSSNRSIRIEESAVGSAIVSGDGNTIYVIQQTTEQRSVQAPSETPTKIGPNPYKGLAAFKERDADRYFGREVQVERLRQRFQTLYDQLGQQNAPLRLLPILGPSGCGKSSLARAGLIPELARRPLLGQEQIRVAVLVPGTHPIEALAGVLAKASTQDSMPVQKTREFATELKLKNEAGFYDGMRRIVDLMPHIKDSPLVVLVDQFEEIYTLCKGTEERHAFIENLICAANDPTGHVSVMITLRSDFLSETQCHELLNQVIGSDQSVIVPAMTEDEMRRAISEPAKQAGSPLDEAIIELLINDTKGREGALPLLQFALTRIWEGLSEGKAPAETYREMGGVGGALAGKAQEIYNNLNEAEKDIVRRVFVGLVQLGEGTRDTRRRVAITNLVAIRDTPDAIKQVISRFSAPGARLVTLSSQEGQEIAEVTHEALFEHWQLLNEWLDSSRDDIRFQRRLEIAADDWTDSERQYGRLWRRPDLDLLKSYHRRARQEMTPLQLSFFKASIRADQRSKVFRGIATGALIMLSGVTSLLAINAQRTKQRAIASQLATKAEWIGSQQAALYTTGSLLAVKAFETFEDELYVPLDVDRALRKGLERLPTFVHQFGHKDSVNAVSFSPDGQTVATASNDNTARLWNTKSGEEIAIFNHEDNVNAVSFSSDGQTVATASADNTARLWNTKSGEEIVTFNHEDNVNAVSFSPDGQTVATASADNTARLWNTKSGEEIAIFNHEDSVNAVSFSPDGQTLATIASFDNTARLWDAENGIEIVTFTHDHESWFRAVNFSPDGKIIATANVDGTARLWNTKSGEEIATLNHGGSVVAVSFSPDGQTVATASADNTARLWDVESGEEIAILNHEGNVIAVSFSAVRVSTPKGLGYAIVTASADNTVRLWDVESGEEIVILNHDDNVNAVSFSSDGQIVVTTSGLNNTVRIWDVESGEEIATLDHGDNVNAVSFSADGQIVVTTSGLNNKARIWDAESGEEIATLDHGDNVNAVSFSSDGQTVATTAGYDNTVRLWDIESGKEIATLKHQLFINTVSFSPDGQIVATASDDNTAGLWNAESGEKIATLNHEEWIIAVEFSPDGQSVVTASRDNTARLWNTKSGEEIATLNHNDRVNAVSFSPNGQTVATASRDNTARLWNTKSGKKIATFDHEDNVFTISFSPDGQTVATASADNTARLWNAESREEIATLNHNDRVNAVSFSPNGQTVATASADNTVRLWERYPLALADEICQRVSRNLTAFEWIVYLKADLEQYELICPQRPIHSSVLVKVK